MSAFQTGTVLSQNSVFMGEANCTNCAFLMKAESGGYQTWICG